MLRASRAKEIDKADQTIEALQIEQRQRWIALGRALIMLKMQAEHDLAFGKLVKEYGFDNRCREHRTAAMNLAQLTPDTVSGVPVSLTHPQRILQWLRENPSADPAASDDPPAADSQGPLPPPEVKQRVSRKMDHRPAVRWGSVSKRAQSGGEGADIADRQMDKGAKLAGLSRVEFEDTIRASAPD